MGLENKYLQAFEKIKQAENVLLVCHERPDGDAVASLSAMSELMEILNKKYTPFCIQAPDELFSYLPHFEKILSNKEKLNFAQFDLIIILDCGQLARSGLADEINDKKTNQLVIEFDHHPKVHDYSDIEIRVPEAASTTEVLYPLFKYNKIKINKNIANSILSGILTDTANFLYPATSDKTIQISSEMLLRGAQLPQMVQKTWYNKSLPAMKLWGLALSKLQINKKYNFGFTTITLEEIKSIPNYEEIDKDIWSAISGYASNLHGVKGILILREEEGGIIKGSLRSAHPTADISKLAQFLGGGGHAKTSGFIIEGKLEKTYSQYKVI